MTFKCPECGSKNDKIRGYEFFAKVLKPSDPWSDEFEFINLPYPVCEGANPVQHPSPS